ncbi:glycosyltransferase family 2 protein [Flavobacterium algicola]|uniref:glycosyltransferase family 2 protein n=1 Tax=Flavobacterium algicola TaxID=556529 RepID=UPI001EFE422A|nr:glycosyltransferase family A protein [Flavobacterium algicola]MCG9793901.1 glycosyltransferase family 2 protein [Flavobacterium algicola]
MDVVVSIIVPCYKQAHFLSEALQSVLDQSYTKWECFIVNDGSPDHTEKVAKEWTAKDRRFRYIFKENGGLPSARNAGISVSEGAFILALDADDILHPDYLHKTVPVLSENENLGVVSCYRYFFKNNISNIIHEFKTIGTHYRDLMFENQLMPSSLYRRKCWLEVGGYDESMIKGFEDWEFWLNITKRGWNFTFVEEFLFYYRKSEQSMLVDTINNSAEANTEYIFKKHKELYIKHFDNTAEVLFYYIKTHRLGKIEIRNSLEYKIGKLIMKPFIVIKKVSNSIFKNSK